MDLKYQGKILDNNEKLGDYKIYSQTELNQTKIDLKQIPGIDTTYKQDCISYDDSLDQSRAIMPCGHVFSSETMTQILQSLVSSNKYEITCPVFLGGDGCSGSVCQKPWSYDLCRKIAVLTLDEQMCFEIGLSQNFIENGIQGQQCPICRFFICNDKQLLRVACPNCSKNKQGYDFCWKCLKQWKSTDSKYCGNLECQEGLSEYLKNCGTITIWDVKDVPKIRICPKCQAPIEHAEKCKHHQCPKCNIEFCFVCLGIKTDGKWPCGSYSDKCQLAPRQTYRS